MQLDKFTIKTQEAIQQAQQMAMEKENQTIECGHLLTGMFAVDENVIPFLFKSSASILHWVLLPEPSIPSKTINNPRFTGKISVDTFLNKTACDFQTGKMNPKLPSNRLKIFGAPFTYQKLVF